MKLQNRTAIVVGPFTGVIQAIMRKLTEEGADAAYVGQMSGFATRFVESLNDAREVRSEYGRAAVFELPKEDPPTIREVVSRVAQGLGRMDVFVDSTPMNWNSSTNPDAAFDACKTWIDLMQPFFQAKARGRFIYLCEDASIAALRKDPAPSELRERLQKLVTATAQELVMRNITVNTISVGLTEDFILQQFPNNNSIRKAVEGLQVDHPRLKLIESADISASVAFLASQHSAPMTGQKLCLTQGLDL